MSKFQLSAKTEDETSKNNNDEKIFIFFLSNADHQRRVPLARPLDGFVNFSLLVNITNLSGNDFLSKTFMGYRSQHHRIFFRRFANRAINVQLV